MKTLRIMFNVIINTKLIINKLVESQCIVKNKKDRYEFWGDRYEGTVQTHGHSNVESHIFQGDGVTHYTKWCTLRGLNEKYF